MSRSSIRRWAFVSPQTRVDETEPPEPTEHAHRQVLLRGEIRTEAACVTVARNKADAESDGPVDAAGGDGLLGDQDVSAIRRDQTGDGLGYLGLAATGEPGEADELVGPDLEADVVAPVVDGQVADPQDRLPDDPVASRCGPADDAAPAGPTMAATISSLVRSPTAAVVTTTPSRRIVTVSHTS